jgi:signal transduction histidine kinase/ligand-binding sensor domain-containing protein
MNQRRNCTGLALICAGLVLFVASRIGAATEGDYLTDVWTADEGLPNSSVTAIAQTPDGYLWVGTYNGLARFDGIRFVTFDPANTPALTHARVRKLFVDDKGTLWINTLDGALTSLKEGAFALEWKGGEGIDPDVTLVSSVSNQVTFLRHRGTLRRKLQSAPAGTGWEDLNPPNRIVGALCVGDAAGNIWYRDRDRNLLRLVGLEFERVPAATGLPEGRVNCLATDARGRLWVGTDEQVLVWDGARFQTRTPTNAELPADVAFLSVRNEGDFWAGVNGRVRKASGREWGSEAKSLQDIFTGNLSRMGVQDNHQGGVWLYDYGRGLMHVNAAGAVRQFGVAEGFPSDRVNCLFEDREGNWWAGLDAAGLVRIRDRRFETVMINGDLSAKPAKSVCEERDGTVWIATLGDGLVRGRAGVFTNVAVPGGTGKGFAFAVTPDAMGRLWMSAGDEDLYVRDGEEFQRVTPVVHGVKAILGDKAGRIWVGTKSGLFVAEAAAPFAFKPWEGISRGDVRALAEDGRGNLWAGAEDGTLYRIFNQTSTAFRTQDGQAHVIWSLLAEDDGTIWVGTFRGGLLRFRAGQFTRFGINEGLPDNVISQIVPDGLGHLWLGSHQGIFRVARSALEDFSRGSSKTIPGTVFGRSDGLPSLECSGGYQPAAWRGADGRLWFTTIKGAVSVEPGAVRPNLLPPPVVIEEVLVNGKILDATIKTPQQLPPGVTVFDRTQEYLEVAPGKHQFEFRYTGLSLVSSARVQFRHRLEGADADWVEAGTQRFAKYNFLPHGTYRFRVIACNSDRVWNEVGRMLTVKIPPHYYETWWFRVFVGLVAAGLVAGAVRAVVTRRLHQKLEVLARQQAVERERARIAKDIHDDLGANLTLIAVLGDLAKQEKAGERIEKMASTARQAVKSLDEIVWAVNPRNDTLAHLLDYTGQFAVDYLRAAGVRCLLDVPEHAPGREVPTNIRHNVFLVVKEALQNIVKHAHATAVWLRIGATGQGLRIVIEDNGRGFEPGLEQAEADGLRNMRQRMEEIGGKYRIQSTVGKGTEIIVELPWPPE